MQLVKHFSPKEMPDEIWDALQSIPSVKEALMRGHFVDYVVGSPEVADCLIVDCWFLSQGVSDGERIFVI